MALRLISAAALAGASALALSTGASAQSYGSGVPGYAASGPCSTAASNRRAGGAVIGGLLGGLVGNQAAASGARDEGAVLGAILGAVVGSELGRTSVNCGPSSAYGQSNTYGNQGAGYGNAGYGNSGYGNAGYGNSGYGNSGYGNSGYGNAGYGNSGYGNTGYGANNPDPYASGNSGLYGGPTYGGGQPTSQCQTVYRTTTFPDGSVVREPVQACRDTRYGGWNFGG